MVDAVVSSELALFNVAVTPDLVNKEKMLGTRTATLFYHEKQDDSRLPVFFTTDTEIIKNTKHSLLCLCGEGKAGKECSVGSVQPHQ
jgi:hypothetical protein